MGKLTIDIEEYKYVPFTVSRYHWFDLKGKTMIQDPSSKKKSKRVIQKSHSYGKILIRIGKSVSDQLEESIFTSLIPGIPLNDLGGLGVLEFEDLIAEAESIVKTTLISARNSLALIKRIRKQHIDELTMLQSQNKESECTEDAGTPVRQRACEVNSLPLLDALSTKKIALRPRSRMGELITMEYPVKFTHSEPNISNSSISKVNITRQLIKEGIFEKLSPESQYSLMRISYYIDETSNLISKVSTITKEMKNGLQEKNQTIASSSVSIPKTKKKKKQFFSKKN